MMQAPPNALLADPWARYLLLDYLHRVVRGWPDGAVLTSWYRDRASNRDAGGDSDSQHLYGLATDWTGPGARRWLTVAPTLGLVAIDEGDHVHVQRFPRGLLASVGFAFPPSWA